MPGDGIVPIGCDSTLIEHNVMRNCPANLPDSEAAAGIWPWSCDNTIIQFNEVSTIKLPGMRRDSIRIGTAGIRLSSIITATTMTAVWS